MLYIHRGQGPRECECGAFVTTMDGEQLVLEFPPIDLEDCNDERRCANLCDAEVMLYNFPFIELHKRELDHLLVFFVIGVLRNYKCQKA